MRRAWARTALVAFALAAAQTCLGTDASAASQQGDGQTPDKAMSQAVTGELGIQTAGDCTWHWFSNRSVCVAVRGTGLYVDTLGAGESYESFRDHGCATPLLYANGRLFRMGSEVCGNGFLSQDFEMNIYMPDNTELCLGWTDTTDRACITVHD
jgi:hypothetical protein